MDQNEEKQKKLLIDITQINDYLLELEKRKNELIIIMAIKDTPGFCIKDDTAKLIMDMGIKTDLRNKHGHSYVAIIDRGEVLCDRLSLYDETILITEKIEDKIDINVMSSVFQKENTAVLMINGIDYSINRRGLNIAIYNFAEGRLEDRVSFDTHDVKNTCYRSNVINTNDIAGLGNPIEYRLLAEQISKQNELIQKLQNNITLNNEKINMLLWQLFRTTGETDRESRKRFFRNIPQADGELRKMQLVGIILLKYFDDICRKNNINYWMSGGTLIGAVRHGGFIPWDDDVDVHMLREDFERFKKCMENDDEFKCYNFMEVCGPTHRHVNKGYKLKIKNLDAPTTLDVFVFDLAGAEVENKVKELNEVKNGMESDVWMKKALPICQNTQQEIRKGFIEGATGYQECLEFFEQYLGEYKSIIGEVKSKDYVVWGIDNPNFMWGNKRIIKYEDVFPLKELEFEGRRYLAPNNAEEFLQFIYGDIYSIPADMMHRHFYLNDKERKSIDKTLEYYVNEKRFI